MNQKFNLLIFGGRGSSSSSGKGKGAGGGGLSAEAKSSYDIEMSDADNFEASFVLDNNTTKDMIGYQMHIHKSVTGNSLIADTQKDVDELKRAYKSANSDGAAYGMSTEAIKGMKQGIKDKIALREKAIQKMTSARAEYEKYDREAKIGIAKAKRRNGRYM